MSPRLLGRVLVALSFLIVAAPAATADEEPVTLFAAASMTDAMMAVVEAHETAGGAPVRVAFASSSTLAKQIENGAPADLYLSADQRWMDYLAERDLLVEGSRLDLAANALVLVAPSDSPLDVQPAPGLDLAGALEGELLAIGDPEHVPAGRYARAALEYLDAWEDVAPVSVFAADVRAALAFVERGEVGAGIVYATDAAISDGVRVVAVFPPESHPPIVYPLAVVAGHDRPKVRAFLAFLASDAAADILRGYGFLVPAPSS